MRKWCYLLKNILLKWDHESKISCWCLCLVWIWLTSVIFVLYDACVVLHFMACYDTGHFHFKLNLNITQLEYIVDWVMVPLNRDFPSATTFAFVGRPWFGPLTCLWSVPPTREGYGRAYPGPVSRHNLVCPLLRFWYRVPEWDCFGHDGGRCVFGRHGAIQD